MEVRLNTRLGGQLRANRGTVRNIRRWLNRNKTGFLFVLPAFVFYALFFIIPLINTFYYSLVRWNGAAPIKAFVGLANYSKLIQDTQLWSALSHNLIWVAVGTVAPIVLALPLALLVTGIPRGRLFFQTAYFMPHILSTVVVAVIWGWIYSPHFGLLNSLLRAVGLETLAHGWLGNPSTALLSIIVASVWHYFGFCLVIFVAGLQSVDMTLVEAAKIDGANSLQRFIHVIVPEMRHVLNMVLVYTLIGGFNVFDSVRVMTDGGPAGATEVIGTLAYKTTFRLTDVGYGATISVIILLLSLFTSLLFNHLRDRGEAVQ